MEVRVDAASRKVGCASSRLKLVRPAACLVDGQILAGYICGTAPQLAQLLVNNESH